jgi:hypothetical protein
MDAPDARPLIDRLARALREHIDGATPRLEQLPNGHVCGALVAPAFDGQDFDARRRMYREAITHARQAGLLQAHDTPLISTILFYSPVEWENAVNA